MPRPWGSLRSGGAGTAPHVRLLPVPQQEPDEGKCSLHRKVDPHKLNSNYKSFPEITAATPPQTLSPPRSRLPHALRWGCRDGENQSPSGHRLEIPTTRWRKGPGPRLVKL